MLLKKIIFLFCLTLFFYFDIIIIEKEKEKDMKHNRISRQLAKGRKGGYYKPKAKVLRLKTAYESLMLDFLNDE